MAVLLIGSTGMGKSTLGNYLLDPDEEHIFENQTFPTATDNKPMTQEVKVKCKNVQIDGYRKEELTIIDTPGLNESAAKDLSHMIDVIKNLNECEEIRACILVVKFNAKIDAQYRVTLEYYSRLLPGLFEKNVIIVMTEFKTDEYSETLRKRQCIDVEQVKRNTILELGKCSNNQITYSPQLFPIDCLVVTLPQSQFDLDFKSDHLSLTTRRAILDYIFHLKPIKLKDQMIAKTDYIKQKDAQEYEKLQGEINGYNLRLQEVHTNSKKVLDDTRQKKMEITETENEISYLQKKLNEKDKTDEVEAANWSINEEGRIFRSFT